ncbi:MAG: bifunctional 2-polyprenyl-6-hydroxyphenol methylase/3-demethylubiquinol 3-O-methyltransferase UbiG [Fimbriimonadaceae bacterium]|nr:bifunctional 2-polyprenyl-6-hydroxyphenol methylase/3-demethylubiquinol 3-O-methyltransferase UbiG [Alphaproteobacteria bacterium]
MAKTAASKGNSQTVDPQEVARFSAMAAEWWDPHGKFKPLHKLNPVRLGYIRDHACRHFDLDREDPASFKGLRVLDIGCGGGLLSEPMARLGAEVVGADPSSINIEMAKIHAGEQGLEIDYRSETAENLAAQGEQFDVVLNMEVVEHVADVTLFMKTCANLVRPGGLMFVATMNRTMKAFALAIVGAEYILRWLPRGTHDWNKFVTPDEMAAALRHGGMRQSDLTGIVYNPLADDWHQASDTDVNYIVAAVKN